jgi:predicted AAA+ superfamily ATPase
MIDRFIEKELTDLLKQFPAVTILGARQTGKTTLARKVLKKLGNKAVYYDLEKLSDRRKLNDIETTLGNYQNKCVIIDEAQTMPELFSALRPLIDEKRKAGRFLLLGSVSPHLVKGVSETLAGRIAHIELSTINLKEALKSKITQNQLWLRGGYPEALQLKTNANWYKWIENYYRNFIERDVNFLMGETLSPSTVNKLWTMLSGINGNIVVYDVIARSLGISRPTTLKYMDFLEGACLVHRLQPWFNNINKRLVKAPKIYFRDTGVLHYLNGVSSWEDLQNDICIGASWEGFVIEQIKQLMPATLSAYFYRTHHGAEADLVLVKGNKPIACIEIKLNNAPHLTRGWHEVVTDLKTENNFVITPNSDTYWHDQKTMVCSLSNFIKIHLSLLK